MGGQRGGVSLFARYRCASMAAGQTERVARDGPSPGVCITSKGRVQRRPRRAACGLKRAAAFSRVGSPDASLVLASFQLARRLPLEAHAPPLVAWPQHSPSWRVAGRARPALKINPRRPAPICQRARPSIKLGPRTIVPALSRTVWSRSEPAVRPFRRAANPRAPLASRANRAESAGTENWPQRSRLL
jgi:hypothetical protein